MKPVFNMKIRTKKRIKKILYGKGGYSLTELLVATIIMLLASSVMVTGIAAASKSFREQMSDSKSNLLFLTLRDTIDYELMYTSGSFNYSGVSQTGDEKTYEVSTFYSPTFCMKNTKTGFISINEAGEIADRGYIVLGENTDDSVSGKYIVSKALYTYGASASVSEFKYIARENNPSYF